MTRYRNIDVEAYDCEDCEEISEQAEEVEFEDSLADN